MKLCQMNASDNLRVSMQSAKRGLSHGDGAEKGASICLRKPAGKEISVWNTQAFAERFPRSYPPKAFLRMPAVSQPAIATMSHCFDATLEHCDTRSKTLAIEYAKSISVRYYIYKLNVLSSKYLSPHRRKPDHKRLSGVG